MQIKEDKMIYSKDFDTNILKEYSLLLKYTGENVFFGDEKLDVDNSKEFFKYTAKYLESLDIVVRKTKKSFYLFVEEKDYEEAIETVSLLPLFFNKEVKDEKSKKLN